MENLEPENVAETKENESRAAQEAAAFLEAWRNEPRDAFSNRPRPDGLTGEGYETARMAIDGFWGADMECGSWEVRNALGAYEAAAKRPDHPGETATREALREALAKFAAKEKNYLSPKASRPAILRDDVEAAGKAFKAAIAVAAKAADPAEEAKKALGVVDPLLLAQAWEKEASAEDRRALAAVFRERFEEPVLRLTEAVSRACPLIRDRQLINDVLVSAMILAVEHDEFQPLLDATRYSGGRDELLKKLYELGQAAPRPQGDERDREEYRTFPPFLPILRDLAVLQAVREGSMDADRAALIAAECRPGARFPYPRLAIEAVRAGISLRAFAAGGAPDGRLPKSQETVRAILADQDERFSELRKVVAAQAAALSVVQPGVAEPPMETSEAGDADEAAFRLVMAADADGLRRILEDSDQALETRLAALKRIAQAGPLTKEDVWSLPDEPAAWDAALDALGAPKGPAHMWFDKPFPGVAESVLRQDLVRKAVDAAQEFPDLLLRVAGILGASGFTDDEAERIFKAVHDAVADAPEGEARQNIEDWAKGVLHHLLRGCKVSGSLRPFLPEFYSSGLAKLANATTMGETVARWADSKTLAAILTGPGMGAKGRRQVLEAYKTYRALGRETWAALEKAAAEKTGVAAEIAAKLDREPAEKMKAMAPVRRFVREQALAAKPFGMEPADFYGPDAQEAASLDDVCVMGIGDRDPLPGEPEKRWKALPALALGGPRKAGEHPWAVSESRLAAVAAAVNTLGNAENFAAAHALLADQKTLADVLNLAVRAMSPAALLPSGSKSGLEGLFVELVHFLEGEAERRGKPRDFDFPAALTVAAARLADEWAAADPAPVKAYVAKQPTRSHPGKNGEWLLRQAAGHKRPAR